MPRPQAPSLQHRLPLPAQPRAEHLASPCSLFSFGGQVKASGFKDPCWQRRVSRWCPKISAPQRVSQRSFFFFEALEIFFPDPAESGEDCNCSLDRLERAIPGWAPCLSGCNWALVIQSTKLFPSCLLHSLCETFPCRCCACWKICKY